MTAGQLSGICWPFSLSEQKKKLSLRKKKRDFLASTFLTTLSLSDFLTTHPSLNVLSFPYLVSGIYLGSYSHKLYYGVHKGPIQGSVTSTGEFLIFQL